MCDPRCMFVCAGLCGPLLQRETQLGAGSACQTGHVQAARAGENGCACMPEREGWGDRISLSLALSLSLSLALALCVTGRQTKRPHSVSRTSSYVTAADVCTTGPHRSWMIPPSTRTPMPWSCTFQTLSPSESPSSFRLLMSALHTRTVNPCWLASTARYVAACVKRRHALCMRACALVCVCVCVCALWCGRACVFMSVYLGRAIRYLGFAQACLHHPYLPPWTFRFSVTHTHAHAHTRTRTHTHTHRYTWTVALACWAPMARARRL